MRLDGRRESSNVEDRRGMSGGAKAGIGGIGAITVRLRPSVRRILLKRNRP